MAATAEKPAPLPRAGQCLLCTSYIATHTEEMLDETVKRSKRSWPLSAKRAERPEAVRRPAQRSGKARRLPGAFKRSFPGRRLQGYRLGAAKIFLPSALRNALFAGAISKPLSKRPRGPVFRGPAALFLWKKMEGVPQRSAPPVQLHAAEHHSATLKVLSRCSRVAMRR